jgi:hypothetical protein
VGPIRQRGTLPLLTPRSRPVLCTHARRRCRWPALARWRQTGAASSIGRCDGASWVSLRSSVRGALPASAQTRRQAGPALKRRLAGRGFPRGQPLARGPSGGRRLPWLAGRARLPDAASCIHGWCGLGELQARRLLCSVAKLRSPFRRRTPPRCVGRVAAWLRANRRSCFRSSVMSGLGRMSLPVQVLQRLVAVKDTIESASRPLSGFW